VGLLERARLGVLDHAQEGRRLQLSLQVLDPSARADAPLSTRPRSRGAWYEYLTPPWARLQALALFTAAASASGDKRAFFASEGFVEQDLLRAALSQHSGQCCTYLRGYQPNATVGDQYHLLSVEYRSPLLWIERGSATFPIYVRASMARCSATRRGVLRRAQRSGHPHQRRRRAAAFQATLIYYIAAEVQLGVARASRRAGATRSTS